MFFISYKNSSFGRKIDNTLIFYEKLGVGAGNDSAVIFLRPDTNSIIQQTKTLHRPNYPFSAKKTIHLEFSTNYRPNSYILINVEIKKTTQQTTECSSYNHKKVFLALSWLNTRVS